MSTHVRIVLADDHALVRRGLAALLQADGRYAVVAEAGDGVEALAALDAHATDLLLLDLSMPRLNGVETLARVRERHPRVRVLVLSMYGDEQFVAQALGAGARGYLLKHAMDDELFRALEAVAAGREYVSAAIPRERLDALRRPAVREASLVLTGREHEVLGLLVRGRNASAIARELGISPHTAVRHRANLMRKLGVHNRVELLRRATELALVVPGVG